MRGFRDEIALRTAFSAGELVQKIDLTASKYLRAVLQSAAMRGRVSSTNFVQLW
jgi:hypothetical protein